MSVSVVVAFMIAASSNVSADNGCWLQYLHNLSYFIIAVDAIVTA